MNACLHRALTAVCDECGEAFHPHREQTGERLTKVSPTNADGMIALAAAINNLANAYMTVGMRPR